MALPTKKFNFTVSVNGRTQNGQVTASNSYYAIQQVRSMFNLSSSTPVVIREVKE